MMEFQVWGLTGSLHTQRKEQMDWAQERLWHWINAFDETCNRFRTDSEISVLNASAARAHQVSPIFERALQGALFACHATQGLCDPTVLPALEALGYDCDYEQLRTREPGPERRPVNAPGPSAISFDRKDHTVTLAPECQLDLGASAKALVVDLVAEEVGATGGVVVEVGGDVAVRGRGDDGPWVIGVSDSLAVNLSPPRVGVTMGGVATSSTTTRTWRVGNRVANHIIDPRTGDFAQGVYATATVAAESCLMANAFSTAALLWGEDAGYFISQAGWSGRLVRHDGTIDFVGGWPHDEALP